MNGHGVLFVVGKLRQVAGIEQRILRYKRHQCNPKIFEEIVFQVFDSNRFCVSVIDLEDRGESVDT